MWDLRVELEYGLQVALSLPYPTSSFWASGPSDTLRLLPESQGLHIQRMQLFWASGVLELVEIVPQRQTGSRKASGQGALAWQSPKEGPAGRAQPRKL